MSMKHPGKHHAKAAAKRREKTQSAKTEKKERRHQLSEARAAKK
jgi:hypothetical protein